MNLTAKEALETVRPHLTEKRFVHTLGVRETAVLLAKRYGADQKKLRWLQFYMIFVSTTILNQ